MNNKGRKDLYIYKKKRELEKRDMYSIRLYNILEWYSGDILYAFQSAREYKKRVRGLIKRDELAEAPAAFADLVVICSLYHQTLYVIHIYIDSMRHICTAFIYVHSRGFGGRRCGRNM